MLLLFALRYHWHPWPLSPLSKRKISKAKAISNITLHTPIDIPFSPFSLKEKIYTYQHKYNMTLANWQAVSLIRPSQSPDSKTSFIIYLFYHSLRTSRTANNSKNEPLALDLNKLDPMTNQRNKCICQQVGWFGGSVFLSGPSTFTSSAPRDRISVIN